MKELIVKNIENSNTIIKADDKRQFTVKQVIPTNTMHIEFVEVEPNNIAYAYHWHEVNEEAFYIISGEGTIKTPNKEIDVKSGDIIFFPAGEQGAHQIKNKSDTEKLIYLDFGRNEKAEIVHFPEMHKIMAIAPHINKFLDY